MAAVKLPPPLFYTVADLAHEWGCHPERIYSLAESGLIALVQTRLQGAEVAAVSFQERERFEREAMGKATARPINPTERRSLLNIIGALAFIAYRGDVGRPYALTRRLEQEAATNGIPLAIGDDALSSKLKSSFELMRALGCEEFGRDAKRKGLGPKIGGDRNFRNGDAPRAFNEERGGSNRQRFCRRPPSPRRRSPHHRCRPHPPPKKPPRHHSFRRGCHRGGLLRAR